jgi:hypothetical protein
MRSSRRSCSSWSARYGAYLLFRTPKPKLVGIAPTTIYQGPNVRIGISGVNLRPFMRVSFDTIQGRTFLIGSTRFAAIDMPDLAPGTYDVVLFDYMQEVDRLPKALTVLPLAPQPMVEMEVAGSFLPAGDRLVRRGREISADRRSDCRSHCRGSTVASRHTVRWRCHRRGAVLGQRPSASQPGGVCERYAGRHAHCNVSGPQSLRRTEPRCRAERLGELSDLKPTQRRTPLPARASRSSSTPHAARIKLETPIGVPARLRWVMPRASCRSTARR